MDDNNIYPLRSKFWKFTERMKEKANKRTSWYNKNKNKNKYKSTFFVDAAPGSNLAKQCQNILHQCHIPIKVMERSGTSIK